jgi:hypothetical protein
MRRSTKVAHESRWGGAPPSAPAQRLPESAAQPTSRRKVVDGPHPPNYKSISIFFANNIGHKGLQINKIISVSERNKRVKAQSLLTNRETCYQKNPVRL